MKLIKQFSVTVLTHATVGGSVIRLETAAWYLSNLDPGLQIALS